MRPVRRIALNLLVAAPLALPAMAAEPDAPQALITRTEAIRLAIQNRLSAKFTETTEHKKDEQGALVEFYSVTDQRLLWVDANGLTERGKAVMAEIGKADDYGLRASDYKLPDPAGFNAQDAGAAEWLADNFHIVEDVLREVRRDLPPATMRSCRSWRPAPWPAIPGSTPWPWPWSRTPTASWKKRA